MLGNFYYGLCFTISSIGIPNVSLSLRSTTTNTGEEKITSEQASTMEKNSNTPYYFEYNVKELTNESELSGIKTPNISEKIQDKYSSTHKRLEELSNLKQGWDGYGALPIEDEAIRNIERVLMVSEFSDFSKWIIFPDVDGSIYLDLKSDIKEAGINIFSNRFSYFIKDKKLAGDKNINFDVPVFIKIMKTLGK